MNLLVNIPKHELYQNLSILENHAHIICYSCISIAIVLVIIGGILSLRQHGVLTNASVVLFAIGLLMALFAVIYAIGLKPDYSSNSNGTGNPIIRSEMSIRDNLKYRIPHWKHVLHHDEHTKSQYQKSYQYKMNNKIRYDKARIVIYQHYNTKHIKDIKRPLSDHYWF